MGPYLFWKELYLQGSKYHQESSHLKPFDKEGETKAVACNLQLTLFPPPGRAKEQITNIDWTPPGRFHTHKYLIQDPPYPVRQVWFHLFCGWGNWGPRRAVKQCAQASETRSRAQIQASVFPTPKPEPDCLPLTSMGNWHLLAFSREVRPPHSPAYLGRGPTLFPCVSGARWPQTFHSALRALSTEVKGFPLHLLPPDQHQSSWIKPEVTVKKGTSDADCTFPPHTARSNTF